MDLEIPFLDGLKTTKQIRRILEETPFASRHNPYICLTAAIKDQEIRAIALRNGVNNFLTKPIFKIKLQ